MNQINQRADGRYFSAVQLDGKRRFVYGKTVSEVKKKLAVLDVEAATNGGFSDSGTKTINDLLDYFLQTTKPTLKPRTQSDYELLASRYIRPALGTVRLSKLTPTHVQRFYSELQSRGLKRAPAQVHAFFHRVCKLAVLWRLLSNNPTERVLTPSYSAPVKEVWTPEQMRRFIEGTKEHRLYPLFALLLTTGCRLGELSALEWSDVDFSRRTIQIKANLQRIKGQWLLSTPKTRSGKRTISLPDQAIEALRLQWSLCQEKKELSEPEPSLGLSLVFRAMDGKALNPSVAQHSLKKEALRLELPDVTPHQFRHLHASILLDSGVPIPLVSQRLGHAKPSITMSIYAHALGRDDSRAVDVMHSVLSVRSM